MGAEISRRVAAGPQRAAAVYRASGDLLAAGAYDPLAFDAGPWYEIPLGADRVSLAYSYTLAELSTTGHAAIRPAFKSRDLADVVFCDVDVDAPAVSGAVVSKPVLELQLNLPIPPVDTVSGVVVLRVPPGMTHVAFPGAEAGDAAHPGVLALWALVGL